MKAPVYVFDSYALICFFMEEQDAHVVKELLRKAEAKECHIKLSLINWGEIYYSILRSKGNVLAEEILTLIDSYPIDLVGLDREIIYQAAQIKARYPISYADSFVAALAMRESAIVVTGDPEFRQLKDRLKIHWLG